MISLAIFASGGGSNALKIIEYFDHHPTIKVAFIVTNNANAGVINIAAAHHIECAVVRRKALEDSETMMPLLKNHHIDYIILAGFLQLIPSYLIEAYQDKIINIHPALLPNYGGKGMYGMHVHKAVVAAREKESGPTIHLVNEEYDKGTILAQISCSIDGEDSPEEVAAKVLKLEHKHFAPTIEHYILSQASTL